MISLTIELEPNSAPLTNGELDELLSSIRLRDWVTSLWLSLSEESRLRVSQSGERLKISLSVYYDNSVMAADATLYFFPTKSVKWIKSWEGSNSLSQPWAAP